MTDVEKTNDLLDEHEAPKTNEQETFDEKTFNDKNEDDAKNYVNSLMEKGKNEDVAEHIDVVAKKLGVNTIHVIDNLVDSESTTLAKKAKEIENPDIVTYIVGKISEKGSTDSIYKVAKNLQDDSFVNKLNIDTVNNFIGKVTEKGNKGCITELAKSFKNEKLINQIDGNNFASFIEGALNKEIDIHESEMDSNEKIIIEKFDETISKESNSSNGQKLNRIKRLFATTVRNSNPDEFLKNSWPEPDGTTNPGEEEGDDIVSPDGNTNPGEDVVNNPDGNTNPGQTPGEGGGTGTPPVGGEGQGGTQSGGIAR